MFGEAQNLKVIFHCSYNKNDFIDFMKSIAKAFHEKQTPQHIIHPITNNVKCAYCHPKTEEQQRYGLLAELIQICHPTVHILTFRTDCELNYYG